ncbi:unnamed protein product, partial [Nesidiocoris tenuis]
MEYESKTRGLGWPSPSAICRPFEFQTTGTRSGGFQNLGTPFFVKLRRKIVHRYVQSTFIPTAPGWPPEAKVTVLRGHTGLVKGVSWDPVGKYLGSQSDDKTVRIWRTCDWSTETVIKKPFERCAGTTMVLRLSWSPDGQILVTAHAMNGDGPTAQIVERDGWEHSKDMVGHGKAVTCTRYSPAITETTRKGRKLQSCTCALGSRDMSVSIWTTSMERPIVVIKDIFSKPVVDLGWSSNGRYLMACSADGSTVFMEFSSDEIGHAISEQQRASILEQMYGKFTVGQGSELLMIENPEVLIHSEKHRKRSAKLESILAMDDKKLADSTNSTSAPSEGGVANGSSQLQSLSASNNNTPGEDNHISSKEPAREETPLPFSSDSMPSFSSCPSKSRIIIEKRDDVVVAPNVTTPVKSSANQSSTPSKCSTPTMNATLTQRLNVGVGRVTVGSEVAAMCTVTHLDAQVSAAKVLNSKAEYKFWLLTLVRFLVLQ